MQFADKDWLMHSLNLPIIPQNLLPSRSRNNFLYKHCYGHLVVIKLSTSTSARTTLWFSALNAHKWPWIWCTSLSFIFIQIQSISSKPHVAMAVETCCGKSCSVEQTAKTIHTRSHAWQQLLLALTLSLPLSHHQTHEHRCTQIYSGHQTLQILSQGSQQRQAEWRINGGIRARDRWAKERTARWWLL